MFFPGCRCSIVSFSLALAHANSNWIKEMTGNQLQWLNCDRLYTNFYTLDLLKLFKYSQSFYTPSRSSHEKEEEKMKWIELWKKKFRDSFVDVEEKKAKKNGNEWLHIVGRWHMSMNVKRISICFKNDLTTIDSIENHFYFFTNSRVGPPVKSKCCCAAAIHWLRTDNFFLPKFYFHALCTIRKYKRLHLQMNRSERLLCSTAIAPGEFWMFSLKHTHAHTHTIFGFVLASIHLIHSENYFRNSLRRFSTQIPIL